MPLTERLEWRGGLFLDLASRLFFGGGRSGSDELPEDNSLSAVASLSSGRIGSLPLFCLTGVQGGCSLKRFQLDLLPDKPAGDHSLAADGQHDSTNQHLSGMFFLFRLLILMSTKELVFKRLICWVVGHNDRIRRIR